jgi:hypothetical protein
MSLAVTFPLLLLLSLQFLLGNRCRADRDLLGLMLAVARLDLAPLRILADSWLGYHGYLLFR